MKVLAGLPEQKTSWHSKRLRSIRYIGSKIRIAPKIAEQLHLTGADKLINVFGGSGAVIMNAGFDRRVYNDIDGDVVNFFRCLQCDASRKELLRRLKQSPMSRAVFNELHRYYLDHGNSFDGMNSVDRAYAMFYKSSYSFGGKVRNGGFGATISDHQGCKEVKRFFGVLRDFHRLSQFWKGTVIESLNYDDLVRAYEKRPGVVFYADPPYVGTEGYYSAKRFTENDHRNLAATLTASPAASVVSYYDCELVRELYRPEDGWKFVEISTIKNSMGRAKEKVKVTELLIIKGFSDASEIQTTTKNTTNQRELKL